MAERNSDFWYSVEPNAPSSSQWYREEKDFGMGGCLDNALERNVGCNLVVVGPLLDGFIKRIGKGFKNKLARSIFFLFKDFSSRKQHCRGLEEKFIQNHGISRNLQQQTIRKITKNINIE